jgi:hypothetical protein
MAISKRELIDPNKGDKRYRRGRRAIANDQTDASP